MDIEVKKAAKENKTVTDKAAEGLNAEISGISYTGVVKLEFSDRIIVPDYS